MGKNIFDLIGNAIGTGVNDVGSFLGTAANDVGHVFGGAVNGVEHGINGLIHPSGPAPSAPAPAPPMVAPQANPVVNMPILQGPLATTAPPPVIQAPPPVAPTAKKSKGPQLPGVNTTVVSPFRKGEMSAYNDLVSQYNKISGDPAKSKQFMNDLNQIATKGGGDYQTAAKDMQRKLNPSLLDKVGQAIYDNSGFNGLKDLGVGLGSALAYNNNPTVQNAVSNDPAFAQQMQQNTDPGTIIPAAVQTAMLAGSAGIGEGAANTLTGLLAKDTVVPTLIRSGIGAMTGAGVNAGITAGTEALSSGLTNGKPTVNGNDVVNSLVPGAVGGLVLSGARPEKAESIAHEQLMKTNPVYQQADAHAKQLSDAIDTAKANNAPADHVKQLTDQHTALVTSMANLRQRFGEAGYHAVPNPGEDNIIREEAASHPSAESYINSLVDTIWANNKNGAGVTTHQFEDTVPGEGGNSYKATRVSNNTPYYRAKYEETGRKPTKVGIKKDIEDFLNGHDNAAKYELDPAQRKVYDLLKERDAQKPLTDKATPPEPARELPPDPRDEVVKEDHSYTGKRTAQVVGTKGTVKAYPDVHFSDVSDTHQAVRETRDALVKQLEDGIKNDETSGDIPAAMKTKAALRKAAEDEMRTNPKYKDLMSKAQKEIDDADAPKKAQIEAATSPEHKAKTDAWNAYQTAKRERLNQESLLAKHDKELNGLRKKGRYQEATDKYDPALAYKRNQLLNQERLLQERYVKAKDAFNTKYPDANLQAPAAARRAKARSLTIRQKQQLDKEQDDYLSQPKNEYTLGDEKSTGKSNVLTVKKKGTTPAPAPQATDKAFEDTFGVSKKETDAEFAAREAEAKRTADTIEKTEKQNKLDAQTAAAAKLREGGSMEDAVKAYQEYHAISDKEARAAVNRVTEEEATLSDKEAVKARNPEHGNFAAEAPKNEHEVYSLANGHEMVIKQAGERATKLARRLSDNDMSLLDDRRGKTIDEFIQAHEGELDNPEAVRKYLEAAQDATDKIHAYADEVDPGMLGLYRQNRGAGLHTTTADGLNIHQEPFLTSLGNKLGASKSRTSTGYDDILKNSEDGRVRTNANYHEDVMHDLSAVHAIKEREVFHNLAAIHAPGEVSDVQTNVATKQLSGYDKVYATPEIAKQWLKWQKRPDESTGAVRVTKKTIRVTNNAVIQATVVNPLIHTGNLLWQAMQAAGTASHFGLLGLARSVKAGGELIKDPAALREWTDYYHSQGGHIDFAEHQEGWVAKATDGRIKGLGDYNKQTLYKVDQIARVANFKNMVENHISAKDAIKRIDDIMGDDKRMGEAINIIGFFVKFARTQVMSLGTQLRHPIKYTGAMQNLILASAAWMGINYALGQGTGNKNAYWRAPGNLGIIKETVNGVIGLSHGDNGQAASQIVTNRINPVIKEGIQQATNYDWFTRKQLDANGGDRLSHAENTILSPINQGASVQSGRKSLPEQLLNSGIGVYLPHAKGDVATTNPALSALNTKGAKTAPGNDPTGYQQEQHYFQTTDAAKKNLDTTQRALYDQATTTEKDTKGNPVKKNESTAMAEAASLYADAQTHPKGSVLEAITQQKRTQAKEDGTALDPLYGDKLSDGTKLTPEMRAEYEHIKGSPYKGDDYVQQQNGNKWMVTLAKDRAQFYADNPIDAANVAPSDRIPTPKISDATQKNMDAASKLDGADKAQFIADHPDIQAAYDKIANYTNDVRKAQGYAAFKLYPKADTETTAIINEYNSLPKHDGSKGGNASVAKWIQANPDKYAKMQNYYAGVSEWELANSAGQDKYVGSTPSQQMLKSAYNLGKYDIAKTTGANGTASYSIDPAQAYASNSTGKYSSYARYSRSGSSSSSGGMSLKGMKIAISQAKRRKVMATKRPKMPTGPKKSTVKIKARGTNPTLRIKRTKITI